MPRLKIALLYGTKPNFDKDAFKYFILYINNIQKVYEFSFPDVREYPFNNSVIDFNTSHDKLSAFVEEKKIHADHFVSIISNKFNNNYFFNGRQRTSVITTDMWDKHFSPPSIFEYIVHCVYTCLIYSQLLPEGSEANEEQMIINIGSHKDTRGCIADFTRQKYDDRIDICLGYICEEHIEEISIFYGALYLNDLQTVIERKWIGSIDEKDSVAYNLKHIFKIDINKDSGFNKNLWDKIKDKFYEIPGSLIAEILKVIAVTVAIYYLSKMGIVEKK